MKYELFGQQITIGLPQFERHILSAAYPKGCLVSNSNEEIISALERQIIGKHYATYSLKPDVRKLYFYRKNNVETEIYDFPYGKYGVMNFIAVLLFA